jgi:hypothetical protein
VLYDVDEHIARRQLRVVEFGNTPVCFGSFSIRMALNMVRFPCDVSGAIE